MFKETELQKIGTIIKIENEGDRLLLFIKERSNYYIIASIHLKLNIGDQIIYEPYGANFGWFLKESI